MKVIFQEYREAGKICLELFQNTIRRRCWSLAADFWNKKLYPFADMFLDCTAGQEGLRDLRTSKILIIFLNIYEEQFMSFELSQYSFKLVLFYLSSFLNWWCHIKLGEQRKWFSLEDTNSLLEVHYSTLCPLIKDTNSHSPQMQHLARWFGFF